MRLKLLLTASRLHDRITPCLRELEHHRLLKQTKPLHLTYCILRSLRGIKDDKCLPFRLQVLFSDDIEDGAVLREDGFERSFEKWYFYRFFEVPDLLARGGGMLIELGRCRKKEAVDCRIEDGMDSNGRMNERMDWWTYVDTVHMKRVELVLA